MEPIKIIYNEEMNRYICFRESNNNPVESHLGIGVTKQEALENFLKASSDIDYIRKKHHGIKEPTND